MLNLFTGLDFNTGLMLMFALLFVLFYEAINGFHDIPNAVATIIYTRAMHPKIAVIMAGLCNFLGVILGGLNVAYAIVHLLPTNMLLNISSSRGLAMIFSMLLSAIIWNLSTWYFGLPASSSHTLIGSIIGVALIHAFMTHASVIDSLNIYKMIKIFLSLIISPLVGMLVSGIMVLGFRYFWDTRKKRQRIHMTPKEHEKIDGKRNPPFWVCIALTLSAIGVSFSHGSNDGQKGIGLLMLVLISIVPAGFVINMNPTSYEIARTRDAVSSLQKYYQQHSDFLAQKIYLLPKLNGLEVRPEYPRTTEFYCNICHAMETLDLTLERLKYLQSFTQLTIEQRSQLRQLLICITDTVDNISKLKTTSISDQHLLDSLRQDLLKTIEYAPMWIIIMVALALSLGTMVGWRQISTTISEKIGKKEMTYAQGLSAQITAAVSIGIASYTGMPVSTTHVLSSAVTGSMIVDGSGVQIKTVKNILLAWLLTIPISIILSGGLYWFSLKFL